MSNRKVVLHVGCGPSNLDAILNRFEWREVRMDIDPAVKPDIIGSLVSIPGADGQVDMVYASHCVEHLYSHEVPVALKEFYRVLKPGGTVQIFVPDLSHVAKAVFLGNLDSAPLYESPAGPIYAVDILYGLRSAVASGNEYYAHKTGFTIESLKAKLQEAGFLEVRVRNTDDWGLAATGVKSA